MIKIAARFAQLLSTNSGYNMISFKIKYEGDELHEDLKQRPCIEIPVDWSNEKAEFAGKMKGALCVELWGNRRMVRADPKYASDLR